MTRLDRPNIDQTKVPGQLCQVLVVDTGHHNIILPILYNSVQYCLHRVVSGHLVTDETLSRQETKRCKYLPKTGQNALNSKSGGLFWLELLLVMPIKPTGKLSSFEVQECFTASN